MVAITKVSKMSVTFVFKLEKRSLKKLDMLRPVLVS